MNPNHIKDSCLLLMKRFNNKEIPLKELSKECALLSLTNECFSEFQLEEYPLKSQGLIDFETMGKTQKERLSESYIHSITGDYYKKCTSVRDNNWGRYSWLLEMKEILKDDLVCVSKIDEILPKFKEWLSNNTRFEI